MAATSAPLLHNQHDGGGNTHAHGVGRSAHDDGPHERGRAHKEQDDAGRCVAAAWHHLHTSRKFGAKKQRMWEGGRIQQKEHEAFSVPVTNAVADPGAVVVHAEDAHATLLPQGSGSYEK